MKRILILTAAYGEGHNSAARGIAAGLARVSPDTAVEVRDLFAETFGRFNEFVRKTYLGVVNRIPRAWGGVYWWLDRKSAARYEKDFSGFAGLKKNLEELLCRFQPDAVASTFPAYLHVLPQLSLSIQRPKNVAVVTDSITVNAIWYRCAADFFLVPNEASAEVVKAGGIAPELIKIFGFPVNPIFADLRTGAGAPRRRSLADSRPKVLYMITAGTMRAPQLVRRLLDLRVELTVTVGRDEKLRRAVESSVNGRPVTILDWTDQMPRLLCENHLLIGKAGGATVQETIAAACPMIVNHIVSGQEEGNARLIAESGSGLIARPHAEVIAAVEQAFANDSAQWKQWHQNISALSRPRAALDTAEFLLSI